MALVIPHSTTLGSRVMVTIIMPTINQIVNVIKESEIDELSVLLNVSGISHLLAGHQAELSVKSNVTASQTLGLTEMRKAVKMMKREEIDAFLSKVIHGQTNTMSLGNNIYVMTQAPEEEEEPCLPHGMSMVNTYTEMTTGSK